MPSLMRSRWPAKKRTRSESLRNLRETVDKSPRFRHARGVWFPFACVTPIRRFSCQRVRRATCPTWPKILIPLHHSLAVIGERLAVIRQRPATSLGNRRTGTPGLRTGRPDQSARPLDQATGGWQPAGRTASARPFQQAQAGPPAAISLAHRVACCRRCAEPRSGCDLASDACRRRGRGRQPYENGQ